jgi:tetratricopeptide (TPR) repeat protein
MVTDSNSQEVLNKLAIESALNCKWQDAEEINLKLLELEPNNTEYLNRLAKANFEQGRFTDSKKIYNQVLEVDPYNSIAQKNLKKLESIKKSDGEIKLHSSTMTISPALFLEEPGITSLVNLVKVAEPQRLLTLSPGTNVNLNLRKRGISVVDSDNQYLGAFPDDSAFHLLKLIKGGNKYQVIIKSVKPNGIMILVREIFRAKKFKNQASFLESTRIMTYSSDNIPLMNDSPSDDSDDSGMGDEVLTP